MVRHGKSISQRFESETQPRRRNSISHPPDNIGISCTVQSNSSKDRVSLGRRRSLAIPRDNIGVACLPTAEKLGNIQEVPEYETSGGEERKKSPSQTSKNQRFTQASRVKATPLREDTNAANQSTSSGTDTESTPNRLVRFDRGRSCKRRDTVGLLSHDELHRESSESKRTDQKSPIEMGISNVRRPRDDPTKPRKPILPRDNIGFACKPLHKSTGRLSGPRLSSVVNPKNSLNGMERRNHCYGKPVTLMTNENKITGEQIKTLRAVSKLSVLLLYIHFLLTYYLSYSKSHRYGKIFDNCPPQNLYE